MSVGPAGEVVPVAYVGQATASGGRSHVAVLPRSPVRVAVLSLAAAGARAWFATAVAGLVVWFLIGVIWPLIAMVFVVYMQRELNRALGQRVPARP